MLAGFKAHRSYHRARRRQRRSGTLPDLENEYTMLMLIRRNVYSEQLTTAIYASKVHALEPGTLQLQLRKAERRRSSWRGNVGLRGTQLAPKVWFQRKRSDLGAVE